MDTNEIYQVLDQAKVAFEALSSTLRQVLGQLKDMQEENSRLHDANQRLTEQLSQSHDRCDSLENELYTSRQEARVAKAEYSEASGQLESRAVTISALQTECAKLREIILTVAAATDAIVNPKAPEVAKPSEATSSPGNPIPADGSGGAYDTPSTYSRW